MRCAVSIYNPGDVAPVHIHTPNASRTILSDKGGYTTIEGERCEAARGDLILTPNGTWHDHGNDGAEPVVWIDVLDFPLMEFLDCVWLDEAYPGKTDGNARAQQVVRPALVLAEALWPRSAWCRALRRTDAVSDGTRRRCSTTAAPISAKRSTGCAGKREIPYDALSLRFVNPATGASLFPTLDYGAQLLRPGEATRFKRETASTLYVVIEGEGVTEISRAALRVARPTTSLSCPVLPGAAMSMPAAWMRSFTLCRMRHCSIRSGNIGRRAGCPTTRSPSSCLSVNGGVTT